jgi:predicted dehydrogenase
MKQKGLEYIYSYDTSFYKIKKIKRKGALGKIYYFRISYFPPNPKERENRWVSPKV